MANDTAVNRFFYLVQVTPGDTRTFLRGSIRKDVWNRLERVANAEGIHPWALLVDTLEHSLSARLASKQSYRRDPR